MNSLLENITIYTTRRSISYKQYLEYINSIKMVDTVPSSDSLVGSGPPPAQSQEDNTSNNIDNNDNKVKSSPTTNSTDAETATTEMSMTPTKQPFLNSPSPITTNNRTPSPVALATAKFEQKGIDSPPKTNKSISSSSASGNTVAEMPPKKNALFSQWQQKSVKASPIIPGQKGNNTSDRPVYTGKRWSPPKKPQSANSIGSGVVTPSSTSKNTTPPFKPPRPPASPKASTSDSTQPSSPQTALEKKFNNTNYEKKPSDSSRNTKSSTLSKKSTLSTEEIIQSSTTQQISSKLATQSDETHNEQSNKINNIESSLDDLRELKEQLRLATAAAGSGVIERDDVSVDEISVHANIEDLKSDMADEWKEKKEKVKSAKQKNQPAKVKKNKMASYWQKTSVGAPALKMDEKVSFRGYGAAKTAALEENKSYNRKSAGSTSAAAAVANDVSNGDDISVVAATKASVNAEDGFRARVVELVSLVMPGEIDHIDELIDEYEGREAELIDTLEAMRENEDLLGDDDDDETALDDSTVREGEVIEASAKPWQSPAVGENIPPPENVSDNNDKSDTIQEHFKKLGAVDAAAPVLSSELEARSSATTDQVSNKSKEFMAVGMAEPVDEEAAIPNNNNEQDGTNNNSKSRSLNQGVSWREKRFWDAKKIFIIVIALLVVVAIAGALGATLGGGGGDDKNSTPSQANTENDDAVSRDPTDYGQGTGIVSGVGVVNDSPTISPKEDSTPVDNSTPDNGIISAGDDTCIMNTFDTGVNTQQLEGVRSLSANYPKVAIDGNKAVVASGSGYVAFFEFNPTTNVWKRTEVFGLIANVGEVNSVAISGNVAVIGAPEAVTDISDDDPLKTGAVFIYEFDDTALFEWRQKKGAYIPNDYKRATMDTYDGANFGQSVDVDGDLIVVGAPEENTNRGSITIFRRDDTSNEWVELKRMKPDEKLCGAEFFGYTVSIYEDVVAASADCDINIVVYKAQRDDDSGISIIPFQQLEYKDPSYGAVSSIAMSWDTLAYSTVSGGLFFYKRDNRDKRFFESQVMRFDVSQSLYEYPLTMDANMLVLAVMNDIFMYAHDAASKEWRQEFVQYQYSSGEYAGYVGASVSLSDGQLLAADRREVNAHDFTECLLTEEEFLVTTTSPSKKPTSSPVTSPPTTKSPVQAPTPPPTSQPVPQPTPPPVAPTPPSDSDCDGHTLNIDVTLDQYPTDTRWEIIPQGQSTAIATSAPYDASLQFSPAETDSVCLPDGTYDFIIYDVYGDGICCDWGEGSYQLAFGDDIVASGGSFGKSETTTFSTPSASSTDPDCYPVSVSLNFDMYPQDESWDITQGGVIVASSSPVAADAKEDTQEVCLPAGDYVFTIYDVYGDGMCCQWGEGKYTVTTVPLQSSNVVIVEGAEFAASESTSFTLPKF